MAINKCIIINTNAVIQLLFWTLLLTNIASTSSMTLPSRYQLGQLETPQPTRIEDLVGKGATAKATQLAIFLKKQLKIREQQKNLEATDRNSQLAPKIFIKSAQFGNYRHIPPAADNILSTAEQTNAEDRENERKFDFENVADNIQDVDNERRDDMTNELLPPKPDLTLLEQIIDKAKPFALPAFPISLDVASTPADKKYQIDTRLEDSLRKLPIIQPSPNSISESIFETSENNDHDKRENENDGQLLKLIVTKLKHLDQNFKSSQKFEQTFSTQLIKLKELFEAKLMGVAHQVDHAEAAAIKVTNDLDEVIQSVQNMAHLTPYSAQMSPGYSHYMQKLHNGSYNLHQPYHITQRQY